MTLQSNPIIPSLLSSFKETDENIDIFIALAFLSNFGGECRLFGGLLRDYVHRRVIKTAKPSNDIDFVILRKNKRHFIYNHKTRKHEDTFLKEIIAFFESWGFNCSADQSHEEHSNTQTALIQKSQVNNKYFVEDDDTNDDDNDDNNNDDLDDINTFKVDHIKYILNVSGNIIKLDISFIDSFDKFNTSNPACVPDSLFIDETTSFDLHKLLEPNDIIQIRKGIDHFIMSNLKTSLTTHTVQQVIQDIESNHLEIINFDKRKCQLKLYRLLCEDGWNLKKNNEITDQATLLKTLRNRMVTQLMNLEDRTKLSALSNFLTKATSMDMTHNHDPIDEERVPEEEEEEEQYNVISKIVESIKLTKTDDHEITNDNNSDSDSQWEDVDEQDITPNQTNNVINI